MSFLKNLFSHDQAQDAHNQIYGGNQDYSSDYQQQNQGSFTHEAIAGAAGFAAMKAYEDRVRNSGQPVSHPMMKEILAGLAAAEVDKLFETKGLDYLDREKAKRMAVEQAHKLAHDKYGPGGVYNPGGPQGQGQNNFNPGGFGGGNYQQGPPNDYNNQGGFGGGNFQQGPPNDYNNQGGYGGGSFQQGPPNDYNNQGGYGGGNFQQGPPNDYNNQGGYGGQNYGNQGQGGYQQQQWGGGDGQPPPEHHHHHHHRREEDY